MQEFIKNLLMGYGVNESLSLYSAEILSVLSVILICLIVNLITKKFLLKAIKVFIIKSKTKWDDVLLEKKILEQLSDIPIVLVIYLFAQIFPTYQSWIERLAFSFIIFNILFALNKILDGVETIYRRYEVSKIRPIKGYLQVIKIFVSITGALIIISIFMERSPWILLSGIGAATAVLMLIFQNSILGLVAGIQLATNDMVQIGDWIEMPDHGADGDVTDISLHTVKVQNFDKTIITIPTYALISGSFKNWRGMKESGGRRIMRSICIDMTSIKFCDEEMLEKFKKIDYIKKYIHNKTIEIDTDNKEQEVDFSNNVNGRHLTNIGLFRIYIQNYLKKHPKISKNMIQIVRQLQPGESGLPIQIYAFTNEIAWVEYEAIQSDIFDHILAIIPEFNLRLYQKPTGYDFNKRSYDNNKDKI